MPNGDYNLSHFQTTQEQKIQQLSPSLHRLTARCVSKMAISTFKQTEFGYSRNYPKRRGAHHRLQHNTKYESAQHFLYVTLLSADWFIFP